MKEVHDYTALDAAVEAKRREAVEYNRRQSAFIWGLYGRAALLIASGVSLLILVVAFAWWLLKDDPVQATQTRAAGDAQAQQQISRIAGATGEAVAVTAEGRSVTTSYTVFRRVNVSDSERVVTGWNYGPGNLDAPEAQYCFWRESLENFQSRRVDLGLWTPEDGVVWSPVEDRYAIHASQCQWKLDY